MGRVEWETYADSIPPSLPDYDFDRRAQRFSGSFDFRPGFHSDEQSCSGPCYRLTGE